MFVRHLRGGEMMEVWLRGQRVGFVGSAGGRRVDLAFVLPPEIRLIPTAVRVSDLVSERLRPEQLVKAVQPAA